MSDTEKTGNTERQETLKEVIVRMMARCGPNDSWKTNNHPDLASVIIELSNLLDEPFTTVEAIAFGERIGVSLSENDKLSGQNL